METIAVYWEPVIKTYGFRKKANLALVRLSLNEALLANCGSRLEKLSETGIGYDFTHMTVSDPWGVDLFLLIDRRWEGFIADAFSDFPADFRLEVISPVELVFFQGPHFGDRYGIADAAFTALRSREIPFLLASCSGASVYFVFSDGVGERAISALTKAFQTPK